MVTQADNPSTALQDQLATDVIAIITSFAGKIHRRRRGQHSI